MSSIKNFFVLSTILIVTVANAFDFPFPAFPQFPRMGDMGRQFGQAFKFMENLGENIKNDIDQKMLPLKKMQTMTALSNGIGGTTIAFYNTGQTRLIRNGKVFQCLGRLIMDPQPDCAGTLQEFEIRSIEDVCYAKNYAQINDHLCLTGKKNSEINFSYMNGNYQCFDADGSTAILMSFAQFRQLCGALPSDTVYKYYPDLDDGLAVPLESRYLDCMEKDETSCTFKLHNGGNHATTSSSHQVSHSSFVHYSS